MTIAPGTPPTQEPRADAPLVGTLIGQYRILELIGEGGMGTVFVGEHTLIKRRAAIKVLRTGLAQNRDSVDRFFNEARAAAAIRHSGVIQIFDFGFADGLAYIVMELLDGLSLASRLRGARQLPVDEALRIARQAASALACAHTAGVIHRDLKPDNLFLIDDLDMQGGVRVKVLDFGIAKLGDTFDATKTAAGGLLGTPLYMAPEQFDGHAGPASDIYALGCVLFESLAGVPPFAGSLTQLVRAHTGKPPPRLSDLRPGIPFDLDGLVQHCLEKDPTHRYPSMAAVLAAIESCLARHAGISDLPPGDAAPPRVTDDGWRWPRPMPNAMVLPSDEPPVDPPDPPPQSATVARSWRRAATGPLRAEPDPETGPIDEPAAPAPDVTKGAPIAAPDSPGAGAAMQAASAAAGSATGAASPGAGAAMAQTQALPSNLRFPPEGAPPLPEDVRAAELAKEPPELRRPPRASDAPARKQRLERVEHDAMGAPEERVARHPRIESRSTLTGGRGEPTLAEVFRGAVPAGFRDALPVLIAFFGELFEAALHVGDNSVQLGSPAIADLRERSHYVVFFDDPNGGDDGVPGELSTRMFRAQVDPLAERLAQLRTPGGSVLIAVLATPQLGQGTREAIFALRRDRNLFVVPIAASEIRRACDAGNARLLLINRIADLHTVSDPFAVVEAFIDPTRCIGFAGEVADLIKHITVGGQIVSVAGPPGSGKTSVVAMAEYGCDTHDVARRFVHLQCSELTNRDPTALIGALQEQIKQLDDGSGSDPAAPRTPRGSTPPPGAIDVAGMRATIMQLGATPPPALAAARLGAASPAPARREQLVIVLEDADPLIRAASSSEPNAERRQLAQVLWRTLAELCSSYRHTVIVTSVRDFQVMDQVPLERPVAVARVPLRKLNPGEAERLVTSIGDLVGFCPDRRALAALYRGSGGNVYALRLLCSHVIRALRELPDYSPLARMVVTPRQVDAAARHIAATGSTFRPHVSVWLDDVERVVLQHVARERPRSPRQIRRALAGSLESAQISRALDGLELMGLIESRRGRHCVRVPVFERWINTHLEPPERRREAISRARVSWIAVGCTITALLFGAYWTWLRSTRSARAGAIGDCSYELDYPDRIGADETFDLNVYQECKAAGEHAVAIEPVLSALQITAPSTNCSPTTASCTTVFRPTAGRQAHDAYQVRLRVDGAPVASAAIERDGFATVRTIGEKTVPAVAFLPLLLSVALSFHKDMRRYIAMLFRRSGEPVHKPPAEPPGS